MDGSGWIPAGSLDTSDRLLSADGTDIRIKDIWVENLEETITVYNFQVEDYHTYYVGDTQILVHNTCSAGDVAGTIGEQGGYGKSSGNLTEGSNISGYGNYKFKEGVDIDLRRKGNYQDALNDAFNKTGISKEDFYVTKWGKDKNGKSFPVEWRANNGAEVSIDLGHSPYGEAPTVPHVGWQTGGKRGNGGALRGHIFVDDVPYNR